MPRSHPTTTECQPAIFEGERALASGIEKFTSITQLAIEHPAETTGNMETNWTFC